MSAQKLLSEIRCEKTWECINEMKSLGPPSGALKGCDAQRGVCRVVSVSHRLFQR